MTTQDMSENTLYREISLSAGDSNKASDEAFALRDRLGKDAMEVLQNLSNIGSALASIIRPGAGLAVVVHDPDDGSDELHVRVVGIEPLPNPSQNRINNDD
jgi:hypothetical protein